MSAFHLPDLGEGLQEAEVVTWHVAEGDHVVADQPLVSVETDKAVVEIPSPKSGHVARLLAKPGERVQVGAPLLLFEEGPHAETGTVVGELSEPAPPAAPPAGSGKASAPPTAATAAPAVRAFARELGVDIASIAGSGPQGTVTRADIEAAVSAGGSSAAIRGARRTMAANMARAWREVVHTTLHDRADVENWPDDEDITVRLIRAIIAGVAAEPSLNAGFDGATQSLRRNGQIDLGLAIDSPEGLFVPVLRDVASGERKRWRQQIDRAKAGVADRSLAPADLRGATISLSNFGTIAGLHASLIVMPPQVAILGAGRMVDEAVRSGKHVVLHRMLPLSLSFDHRAVTGGEAARFLRAVIADLETSP